MEFSRVLFRSALRGIAVLVRGLPRAPSARETERLAMCAAGSTWRPPWVEAGPKPNHPEPFGTGWLAWGCAKGGTNCKRLLFPCVECLGKRIEGMADKPQFQVALSRDWGELLHEILRSEEHTSEL